MLGLSQWASLLSGILIPQFPAVMAALQCLQINIFGFYPAFLAISSRTVSLWQATFIARNVSITVLVFNSVCLHLQIMFYTVNHLIYTVCHFLWVVFSCVSFWDHFIWNRAFRISFRVCSWWNYSFSCIKHWKMLTI